MVQEANTTQHFSLEEVSRHNGKIEKAVWLVIKGSLYDVSDYLDKHPGGRDIIEQHAGKDASKHFLTSGILAKP
ncbi:unnamed protein product [Acanthoscelides obtectus]|uniref:Cytochrome b5 heme-binding domain-containing protein n=1 Tax=Acanthoscelides obtectus TaxID=200917 RepID=A0A9P0PNW6_ACAOB|nr:unnamed protein product [Acanthoscelides obtectus]CAK1622405.1 Cytochrome b5 isoform A [Acanthoscelides obtectus]